MEAEVLAVGGTEQRGTGVARRQVHVGGLATEARSSGHCFLHGAKSSATVAWGQVVPCHNGVLLGLGVAYARHGLAAAALMHFVVDLGFVLHACMG